MNKDYFIIILIIILVIFYYYKLNENFVIISENFISSITPYYENYPVVFMDNDTNRFLVLDPQNKYNEDGIFFIKTNNPTKFNVQINDSKFPLKLNNSNTYFMVDVINTNIYSFESNINPYRQSFVLMYNRDEKVIYFTNYTTHLIYFISVNNDGALNFIREDFYASNILEIPSL